jgi:hypothetical protein
MNFLAKIHFGLLLFGLFSKAARIFGEICISRIAGLASLSPGSLHSFFCYEMRFPPWKWIMFVLWCRSGVNPRETNVISKCDCFFCGVTTRIRFRRFKLAKILVIWFLMWMWNFNGTELPQQSAF